MLKSLCESDWNDIKAEFTGGRTTKTQVALIPDLETMHWHHLREDFMTKKLFGRSPDIKGAVCGKEKSRVWAIWTRSFYGPLDDSEAGNTLHILRLVVEDESEKTNTKFLKAILDLAQSEAAEWKCKSVELWNPSK